MSRSRPPPRRVVRQCRRLCPVPKTRSGATGVEGEPVVGFVPRPYRFPRRSPLRSPSLVTGFGPDFSLLSFGVYSAPKPFRDGSGTRRTALPVVRSSLDLPPVLVGDGLWGPDVPSWDFDRIYVRLPV